MATALLFWVLFEFVMNSLGPFMTRTPNWLHGSSVGSSVSIAMVGVTYLFLKYDKLTFSDLGMTFNADAVFRFIFSLVAGMVFFGCFYLLYLWLTPVEVVSKQNVDVVSIIPLAFLSFLMLSLMEEIAFRGYFLKKLETAIGIRAAIYMSSLVFGLYHGFAFGSITGPAVWGLLYGVLVYWSKDLAVPIGFHAGANLIQGYAGEKERYADGLWAFELTEKVTPFTVVQFSFFLQIFLFVLGVVLVEVYLAKNSLSNILITK